MDDQTIKSDAGDLVDGVSLDNQGEVEETTTPETDMSEAEFSTEEKEEEAPENM